MSNSLAAMRPELVREWSEKNLPLMPNKITYGSNKIVWWKAACGHEWQTSVKVRSGGKNCPICLGARGVKGINDLFSCISVICHFGENCIDKIFAIIYY